MVYLNGLRSARPKISSTVFSSFDKGLKIISFSLYALMGCLALVNHLQAADKQELESKLPVVKITQEEVSGPLALSALYKRVELLETDNRSLKKALKDTEKQLGYLTANPPTFKKYIPADNLFLVCMSCGLVYGVYTFDLINGLYYAVIGLTVIATLRNFSVIRGTPQPRATH